MHKLNYPFFRKLVGWAFFIGCLWTLYGQAFSQCPSCPPQVLPREKIYILYFYRKTDSEYIKTTQLLKEIVSSSTRLDLAMKDMSKPNTKKSRAIMNALCGMEESDMRTPSVFVGKNAFIGYNAIREGMSTFINDVAEESGTPQTFSKRVTRSLKIFKLSSIIALGGTLGLVVILAGLIDGINPCALSVLIFFITAISPTLKEKKAILIGGIGFTVGSFIAYFMIGLGLLRFIQSSIFSMLSSWFYVFIGILALLLGGITLFDFYKAKIGRAKQMKLQLPPRVKRAVHNLIHESATFGRINIMTGFVLGFLVSLFEFPCTGQVYLPIVALIGNPWSSVKPLFYLTLYNLVFISPLVLVIVASAFLVSSEKLVFLFSRHIAGSKLAMACLFFIIAIYMFGLL